MVMRLPARRCIAAARQGGAAHHRHCTIVMPIFRPISL
jgi:hypothetical protein